jgi:hypothetical protein
MPRLGAGTLILTCGEGGITSAPLRSAPLIPGGGASAQEQHYRTSCAFFVPVRFREQARIAPRNKKIPSPIGEGSVALVLAERGGFEPPEVLPSTVFETATINRSATSPGIKSILTLS